MSAQKEPSSAPNLKNNINELWPGFKYLGFGLYLAWLLLISDTCSWVSDIGADGSALLNGNLLITLCGPLNISAATTLIAASFMGNRMEQFLDSTLSTIVIGALGALGALCVIGSGPYFFGGPFALDIKGMFSYGAIIYGITAALLIFKCAQIYGKTEPYRVFMYCLLSELLVGAVYSLVICNDYARPYVGGPPASGIIALTILPLLSSLFMSVAGPVEKAPSAAHENEAERKAECKSFLHFVVMLFTLSLAVSISLGFCANNLTVNTLQVGMRRSVLLQLMIAAALIVLTVSKFKRVPLASICVLVSAIIAVALALFPIIGLDSTVTYISVNVASNLFNIMIWSLLSFVAFKQGHSSIKIFGQGFGASMAGQGIGWLATKYVMPALQANHADFGVYVALAFATLLLTVIVFSGKDFVTLFTTEAEAEFSMKQGETMKNLVERAEPGPQNRPWKKACKLVCDEADLSPREREIFALLSTGHTAEAIANELSISANTVRTHVHNIYGKLDVHSRQELIDLVKSHI